MHPLNVGLYVEGQSDKKIVSAFLKKMGFPIERINIEVANGKHQIAKLVAKKKDTDTEKFAALIDLDAITSKDAVVLARKQLANPAVTVFCAVPTIEAWLLADPDAVEQLTRDRKRDSVKRLPLPEQIPYPKYVLTTLLGNRDQVMELLENIDLEKAMVRSPSLKLFLEGMAKLLDVPFKSSARVYAEGTSRNAFSNLVSEVVPSKAIIFRTLDGTKITAAEMLNHIRDGDEIGMQYCSDVLRIARDLLMRKAQE